MIDSDDDSVHAPREGAFDAQMSFSVPFVDAPSPIGRITKRDGRDVPFERRKIAEAIFRAAGSIGGTDRDRAKSLASAVAIYLAKHVNGATPTVDHVHDAVEKVLIEMGHARTALAYVRYRDKRTRLRKLRAGDVSSILAELDEAREQRETLDPVVQRPLFVRTSSEELSGWDRERIVQALVREARMPEPEAWRIAAEVEVQVTRAGLTTLTAALVRELVDAKLVELGLERYRARHMRLGVPLYDAEQIVCTPNQGEIEGQQDPSATDVSLARRVKCEFALSSVHSADVTEAHLRGIIHLHGLSQIDRVHSATLSLEFVKRFGLAIFSGNRFSPPPSTASSFISQIARFATAMQHHFIEGVRYAAFNESLTPMVRGNVNMDRLARLVLAGLVAPAGSAPAILELCWPHANIAACMFALQFAEIWGAAIDDGGADGMPHIAVVVGPEALDHADFRSLLDCVLDSRARRSRVTLRFDRGMAPTAPRKWHAAEIVGGTVTLNLPRAAYEMPDEDALCDALAERARIGFGALAEKKRFLERLFAFGGIGPLAALTFRNAGVAYADPLHASYVLGVTGLNECVQKITGEELHGAPRALACAKKILARLRDEADRFSKAEDIHLAIGADGSEVCARRFARLDLQLHPGAARTVAKYDDITRDATYTPGIGATGSRSPLDTIRAESDLLHLMRAPKATPVIIESSGMPAAAVIGVIETALCDTECVALRFVCGREQLDFGQL